VRDHRASAKRPKKPALLLKFFAGTDPNAHASLRAIQKFEDMEEWFRSWAHFREKLTLPPREAELGRWFEIFETFMVSFVGNFFTITEELDAILEQANR
jgi:hypothetical protein